VRGGNLEEGVGEFVLVGEGGERKRRKKMVVDL
jgi:hypothetical protein